MIKQPSLAHTGLSGGFLASTILIVLTITITAFVLNTFASFFIILFEGGAQDANIKTGSDAFWWALVTVTTMGNGDYVPVTYLGSMLAVVLMTFGIGIFAVLTSSVATGVVGLRDEREDIIATVKEENPAIHAELAEVKE